MPDYIINREKTDGRYNEVHTTFCQHRPDVCNQVSLGWHANAVDAVAFARRNGYPDADGCYFCSSEAHRG